MFLKKIRMKKNELFYDGARGFTLLELIVVITVAAIFGSMLVTFMGTAITKSSDPVNMARNLGAATGDIEVISAAYATYLAGGTWAVFMNKCTTCTEITGSSINDTSFKTFQVTVTKNNLKIVSYFMQ